MIPPDFPKILPPVYPLDVAAFRLALINGHGRALLHALRHGTSGCRDEILHAATTCLVYDSQVDGHREWWLARLCEAAGLVDEIIQREPDGSSENRALRAGLLKEFHLAGHPDALSRLYAMCRCPEGANVVEAIDELIEVDGEKGLLFAARELGAQLDRNPDFWVDDWEISEFDRLYGDGAARQILAKAAGSDPQITRYLEALGEYEARGGRPQRWKLRNPQTRWFGRSSGAAGVREVSAGGEIGRASGKGRRSPRC